MTKTKIIATKDPMLVDVIKSMFPGALVVVTQDIEKLIESYEV